MRISDWSSNVCPPDLTLRTPLRYLLPDDGTRHTDSAQLPWRDLQQELTSRGWVDLTNTRTTVEVRGLRIAFAGVDDPHLGYDRLEIVRASCRERVCQYV